MIEEELTVSFDAAHLWNSGWYVMGKAFAELEHNCAMSLGLSESETEKMGLEMSLQAGHLLGRYIESIMDGPNKTKMGVLTLEGKLLRDRCFSGGRRHNVVLVATIKRLVHVNECRLSAIHITPEVISNETD